MIEFAPNSPWPRRIKRGLIAVGVLVVFLELGGLAGRHWIQSEGGAGVVSTRARVKSLDAMLRARYWVKHSFPTQADGLNDLGKNSRMLSAQVQRAKGEDPTLDFWKRKIQYRFPGVHNKDSFDLWSYGEDGEDGTDDDITNW